MKVQNDLVNTFFILNRDDLKPLMYSLCNAIFGGGEKKSNEAIIYCNEYELSPTQRNYERVMDHLGIDHFTLIKSLQESRDIVIELIADFMPDHDEEQEKPMSLKLARICGFCGNSYISEKRGHDCVQSSRI